MRKLVLQASKNIRGRKLNADPLDDCAAVAAEFQINGICADTHSTAHETREELFRSYRQESNTQDIVN